MRVALLTIGQSPRYDIYEDLGYLLEGLDYIERGILDNLPKDLIRKELVPKPSEDFYITRLRDGSQVRIPKKWADKKMQELVREVEDSVDLIVIMCTGDFTLESKKPIILPSKLTMKLVEALSPRSLGVLVPGKGQEKMVYRRWVKIVDNVRVYAWSPYNDSVDVLKHIATKLSNSDLIVLDCIGYGTKHGELIRKLTNKPTLVPRYVVLSVVAGLLKM